MAFDQTLEQNTTSKIIEVMMRDSTTGQGLVGINGVNAVASYVIEGSTSSQYTLANGLPGASYTSGVWAEVDSANMPGIYQLHVPNAAFATTSASVTLTIKYAGALDKVIRVCLLAVDLRDAANMGLTNLDATISSRSTVAATDIVTGGAITTAGGAVSNVTLVATTTTNTDMVGTNNANTVAPDNAGIAANGTAIANIGNGTTQVTLADTSLAKFATFNTNAAVVTGSIAQLSQGGGGGGSVTVGGFDLAALQALVQTDTTLTSAVAGSVAALSQSTPLDATGTASAVWDALYASHTGANTFGKLMDQLRKSNLSVDGTVTSTTTPTASAFDSGIAGYVSGAFDNALLLFVSGSLEGESRAVLTYTQTNGRMAFEEAFSVVPQPGDEFVILPAHIHPVSEIQAGLARTTDLATVIKTGQQYTATAQSGDTIQVELS